ncbi:MAG: SMC-Scp complex subunit ScpB [Synergistaceae bacterium]|jgi:segregation and condensation protein B|nr:SMC-Scp complex subunit ScpB [Synergistaceae bacterium]
MSKSARRNDASSPSFSSSSPSPAPLSVLAAQIEAVLFLAADAVSESELKNVFGVPGREITTALSELREHLAGGHGIVLRAAAGGWVLETSPHFAEVLSLFRETSQKGRVRLSRAAVETLAVVAWNQPVTRAEVEDLRGVRCERVIETLLSHGLIRISGRKKASGSPLLYRTTGRFLDIFGLEAIADLPNLEELGELGADPLENIAGGDDPASNENFEIPAAEVSNLNLKTEGSGLEPEASDLKSDLKTDASDSETEASGLKTEDIGGAS